MKTQKLIRSLDIKKFISKYKLQWKETGDDLIMCCPFHKDRRPSFAMSFKGRNKGRFICYSGNCGVTGNFIDFVSKIEEIDKRDTLEMLEEEYENTKVYNLKDIRDKLKNAKKEMEEEIGDIKQKQQIVNLTIEHENLKWNVYKKRLINYLKKEREYKNLQTIKKIIKKFKIKLVKHCRLGLCICIPIIFNKRTIAFYYEKYSDRAIKRFSTDSKVSKFLFHFDLKPSKKKIIVEGIWDMIKVWSTGNTNVTTCFTSRLSNEQAYLLNEYVDLVIIFFDGDKSGRIGSNKARHMLEPTNTVLNIKTPESRDPGNLSKNRILELVP